MKKIVTLDSQILNTIQLCETRAKYAFIDNIAPLEKAEALERGDLMHKILEVYESLRCHLVNPESETWRAIGGIERNANETNEQYAVRAGRMLSTKMDLGAQEIEEVIFQFQEYVKFYQNDTWETLAVESVGSKVLHEDDSLQILYSFKIDRLSRRDTIIAPWDYKTSKKRTDVSSLSNQFLGYAWATDSNYVVVDKIGFQKTLKPEERFQRILLAYDQDRIDEWVRNSVHWAKKYARLLEKVANPENFFTPELIEMNLTSCDKYSGCIFRPICDKGPHSREWIIKRDYKVSERWDPASVLEGTK